MGEGILESGAMGWVVFGTGALGALLWMAAGAFGMRFGLSLPRLEDGRAPAPDEELPKLSVIVPACNEAGTLRPALTSLLAQPYPNLEVVVINDRSTDETGRILDEIAATDARVVAVHIDILPEGWLGKVHALERGAEAATGELLLFTDADIHFRDDALVRAVVWMKEQQLDHLTLFPEIEQGTFWQASVCTAFAQVLAVLVSATREDDDAKVAIGVGAFNLVRPEALARAGGFAPIKMEVADDTGLATIIRLAGGKSRAVSGMRHVRVAWYESLRAMAHGLEKNSFAVFGQYSLVRMLVMLAAGALYFLSPLMLLVPGPVPFSPWLALAPLCTHIALTFVNARRFGFGLLPALASPIGALFLLVIGLRGTVLCLMRGGINWRGTRYSLASLREGQVVRL